MFFCIPVQLPMQQNLNNITLEMMWTVYLDYSRHNGIAIYFISIGAWWMICLHSTISHAHKRYHLTIQNWYYSICSIVILDHIFVEFFWLAAAVVMCHHWSVENEQKRDSWTTFWSLKAAYRYYVENAGCVDLSGFFTYLTVNLSAYFCNRVTYFIQ